ncbi:MAG: antibiotic biosynthesis monooxygenase [Burkholderiales bacterium]|jgi:quinol monooxygenase YgiN|nr:antibiotic biosynthesis monooxygenase [Betaproteobacteria bacterium]MBP8297337.1 antibiotic biosynthesis monooxygenase [Burkholderiales bacterium]
MKIFHTAHLRARPDAVDRFRNRLLLHARTSLEAEPAGCLQFDVHQDRDDPALFLLIETYRDQAALEAHRSSGHFQAFRRDTQDWVIDRTWWFWRRLPPE